MPVEMASAAWGSTCRYLRLGTLTPGELFCEVGTFSHILGSFYLHSRKTPLCCSPALTAAGAALVVGRRVAVRSRRGFTDLLRRRTSENTGRMERLLATSAFALRPHPHPPLPFSLLSSRHSARLGLCPSVEQNVTWPVLSYSIREKQFIWRKGCLHLSSPMDWSHLWNNVLNICILYICREKSNFCLIFLFPIKNLVFDTACLPGTLSRTCGCSLERPPLSILSGQTDSEPEQAGSCPALTEQGRYPWFVMGCPLLSKVCPPNYLTLENEILTSFRPFSLLLSARVWVESQEDNFRFNPASVQITAHTADSQKNLPPRTWGWKQHHIRRPVGPGFLHFLFCICFELSRSEISPPCHPPLVEDHKLRCLLCMPFVSISCFCSLTAEPQPVWVLGALSFQRKPALWGSWIAVGKLVLLVLPASALPPLL